MSRIGKKPIQVPPGVEVKIKNQSVETKGSKGVLTYSFSPLVSVEYSEANRIIRVDKREDSRKGRALQGLTRALIHNMVKGVSEGFEKSLEINGVGYNAKVQGKALVLQVGFCHPVVFEIPKGLEVEIPVPTRIRIKGADKQGVGQFAATVRGVRPPEPYNLKGIKYEGEVIKRKSGKTFVSAE